MRPRSLIVTAFFCSALAFCQKPEYDFYTEFRNTWNPKVRAESPSVTNQQIAENYAARLKSEGVADGEIARRMRLIETERSLMEADYYNRFYTQGKTNYNKEPNAFLEQMVEGRMPGAALDYGMGDGRNALYLAKLGWRVWGFDPADAAVAFAQKRAKELGLTLNTAAVRDSEYGFGKERFDLVLFSWTMPLIPVQTVIDSMKRGGIVVMECAPRKDEGFRAGECPGCDHRSPADFVRRNEMLKTFDALRIVRYEIVKAKADFYDRRETDVLRLVAIKP